MEDLDLDPIAQFTKWFSLSEKDNNPEQTAMILSTVSKTLEVSSRVVLLKEVVHDAFRFFTNYGSQKGHEINENSNVSLLFFWPYSEKQIRIKGKAIKTPAAVSDEYFYSRPLGSQAGAIASQQSSVLPSKDELIFKFEDLKNQEKFTRPENWGGYDVIPFEIEFWQGGINRLHDRFRYTKTDSSWKIERLAP